MSLFAPHQAEPALVLTIIGNDGVRWACTVCNQTVYTNAEGVTLHFDDGLDLSEPVAPFPDAPVNTHTNAPWEAS